MIKKNIKDFFGIGVNDDDTEKNNNIINNISNKENKRQNIKTKRK